MDKDKRSTLRLLTPIHVAIVAIVIVSIVLIVASYEYGESDRSEWISSILLDVGFIMLGLAIAFVIGERLVNAADDHKWHEVDAAVCNRAFRAALTTLDSFASAPSIKAALESGQPGTLPSRADLLGNYAFAVQWCHETLLPTMRQFTGPFESAESDSLPAGLTRFDWAAIRSGANTAYSLTTATVTLALPRDIPSLLSDLLDLETALNSLSTWLARGVDLTADRGDSGDQETALELVGAVAEAAFAVLQTIVDHEN